MSEPESSEPKNPQSASDATQRFAAGEPPSPFSTQRLSIPKLLAEGTLKMPLPELSVPTEQTQQPAAPEAAPVVAEAPPRPKGGRRKTGAEK